MSVLPFVRKSTPASVRLTVAQITDLTEMPFPDDFAKYEETGFLCVEDETRDLLAGYLAFYGLSLPFDADANAVFELWRHLRLHLGQAVRLASRGRSGEVAAICEKLTQEELTYAIAVGEQRVPDAQRLARSALSGRKQVKFHSP